MFSLSGRMVLNEILNSDHRDLAERLDKHPDAVDSVGVCGESPAHIAIYKRDSRMLKMLLDAGTSPNIVNLAGDSLVHVSARLGFFECIQILYQTAKCDLVLKNKLNQTALDIAQSDVQKHSLHVLKLFAEYHIHEPSESAQLEAIVEGRALCAAYLAEKMVHDREDKVRNMVQSTLDATNERRNKARILRGVGGSKVTSFHSDLTYNTNINKPPWGAADMDFFTGYKEGIDTVVRTAFACDYVNKSIRVGFHNVLVSGRCQLPKSTYPVPVAEAVIPFNASYSGAAGASATTAKTANMSLLERGESATQQSEGSSVLVSRTRLLGPPVSVLVPRGGGVGGSSDNNMSTTGLPAITTISTINNNKNANMNAHRSAHTATRSSTGTLRVPSAVSSLAQDIPSEAPTTIDMMRSPSQSSRRNLLIGNRASSSNRRINSSISDQST